MKSTTRPLMFRPMAILVLGFLIPHHLPAQNLTTDSGAPDMSNVKDVLHGQRLLLRQDDITLLVGYKTESGLNTNVIGLPTANSHFSSDSSTIETSVASGVPASITPEQASAGIGRMYQNGNDVVVTVTETSGVWTVNIWDPVSGQQKSATITGSQFQPYGQTYKQVVMGDFNGDGLQEALLFYASNASGNHYDWGLSVISAADQKSVGSMKQGPQLHVAGTPPQPAPITGAFVAGDFDNDGREEIASLLTDGKTIQFYSVDSTSLTISASKQVILPNAISPATLAAGRFRNTLNDELVAVGQVSGSTEITIYSIQTADSNSQLSPAVVQTFTAPGGRGTNVSGVLAQAAPIIDWYQSNYEQLLIGLQYNATPTGIIWIAGFDSAFIFKLAMVRDIESERGCLLGMQVGNFDNQVTDSQGQRVHNPNLQLALFELQDSPSACTAVNGQPTVKIVDINVPSGFDPTANSSWPPASNWLKDSDVKVPKMPPVSNSARQFLALSTGDLRGRSLVLGAPEKVVIPKHIQPDIVLGVPPMHIDFVKPNSPNLNPERGCTNPQVPCVLNLTFKPTGSDGSAGGGFTTTFNFSSTAEYNSDRTATTSWGIAVKEGTEVKASFNDGEEGGSVDIKDQMTTTHNSTVSKQYNKYTGMTDTQKVTTGFADHIFYTEKYVNVYYYPVLGRTGCPSDNPTCSDSQKLPSYVTFSVPDTVQYGEFDGTTLEWYQPVHEPGNILSYPRNKALLQAGFNDLNGSSNAKTPDITVTPLTKDPPPWTGTDSTTDNYTTTWTITNKDVNSVGSASSFSDDLSVSYTDSVGDPSVDGASATFSLDINTSTSLNTLNVTTASLGASTGIYVNKPLFEGDVVQCCAYNFAGYIFGQQGKNSPWQDPNGMTMGANGNPVDYKATGPMYVGFLTDPLPATGGNPQWWSGVYNTPDVALNHPARWTWEKDTKKLEYVAAFNKADRSGASSPLDQPFYQMKGFFISKADDSSKRGPNLSQANPGDQLTLTVRVYNYSLVDTNPTNSQAQSVRVRFYGQRYCGSIGTGHLCGDSFYIGDAEPILNVPGASSTDQNWVTASVNFDTTPYPNTQLVFWVVAWMQDRNGVLLKEMPAHGLTAVPSQNAKQIIDVAIEDYSNNVGMYGVNSPFFILPAASQGGTGATVAAANSGRLPSVNPGTVGVSQLTGERQIVLEQRYKISAHFESTGGPAGPLTVGYYDGNPQNGGKLIDVQRIPYIPEVGSYNHRIFYQPKSCGDHTLFAQTFDRGHAPTLSKPFTTHVLMDYVVEVRFLMAATNKAKMPESIRQQLQHPLQVADRAFREQQHSAAQAALQLYVQLIQSDLPTITRVVADPLTNLANTIVGCISSVH